MLASNGILCIQVAMRGDSDEIRLKCKIGMSAVNRGRRPFAYVAHMNSVVSMDRTGLLLIHSLL